MQNEDKLSDSQMNEPALAKEVQKQLLLQTLIPPKALHKLLMAKPEQRADIINQLDIDETTKNTLKHDPYLMKMAQRAIRPINYYQWDLSNQHPLMRKASAKCRLRRKLEEKKIM